MTIPKRVIPPPGHFFQERNSAAKKQPDRVVVQSVIYQVNRPATRYEIKKDKQLWRDPYFWVIIFPALFIVIHTIILLIHKHPNT